MAAAETARLDAEIHRLVRGTLQEAARVGELAAVQELVAELEAAGQGAQIDAPHVCGTVNGSAYVHAAMNGHRKVCAFLQEHGADISAKQLPLPP